MKLNELAYFAGIVDGEGTIQIICQHNMKRGGPKYYTTGFYVSNSNMNLLYWIQTRFGGNITKARQNVGKNWKPVYRIQFYSSLSEKIIKSIMPFLVIKKQQAELFLELRKRGLLLNEREMIPSAFDAHLKKVKNVWMVEFPSSKYNELRKGLKITDESHSRHTIKWIHLIWFVIRFCTGHTPN